MKEHKISLTTAILLNMNIMIGSGILIGPGASAAISGNASFLAWPLVALLFLPMVLSTIELSRMFPGAGGFYLYARQGLNKTAGFAAGWLYILGYTFASTVEIMALHHLTAKNFGNWTIVSNAPLFYALTATAVFLFSLLSLKIVSKFLDSLTIIKILPLVILILILPFILNPSFSISGNEFSLLPASLAMPIFGFFGFEYCVGVSHLIKDSEKNAPRAILIGFLGTALLYTLFQFGLLNVMGAQNLAQIGAPNFPNFITLPIPYLKSLLSILIPTASALIFIASLIGMINANAILVQTFAKEGLFKGGSFLTAATSLGRPWMALLVQSVIVFLIACVVPTIDRVGGLCLLGVFLAFLLPFISLFIVQQRSKMKYKMFITLLAIILVILLSGYSWYVLCPAMAERMIYTLVLVTTFVLGMALYNKNIK